MGAGFAGNGDAAFFGLAQQLHAARRTQMLAMHLRPGQTGQQDIARDDQFLARSRPAAQPKGRAPVTFMHHAVGHDGIILAMIHDGQIEHPGIFQGPAHQIVVLHAMAVVTDGDDAGGLERADGANSSPAMFLVMAPATKTLILLSRAARSRINATVPELSMAGEVLGMQTTEVKPPRAAEAVPVAMVSLADCPGSRKCACKSINPGQTTSPVASNR